MMQPTEDRPGCREVMRMLQAFLDGEVRPDRAEMVAAHLESCRRCELEADTYRRVIDAIRSLRPDLDLAAYTRLAEAVERLFLDADAGPRRREG